jgi:hypothetical protein
MSLSGFAGSLSPEDSSQPTLPPGTHIPPSGTSLNPSQPLRWPASLPGKSIRPALPMSAWTSRRSSTGRVTRAAIVSAHWAMSVEVILRTDPLGCLLAPLKLDREASSLAPVAA